ncbi:MAG: hypothetical protein FJ217_02195 [Ignavibacteria bacterium]|nr:hypothetical protein [Ignavibacteria bacterium]
MVIPYLALISSGLGMGLVALSSVFQDSLNRRISEGSIRGGYFLLLAGVVLGALSMEDPLGAWALGLSAASGGICGTGYLFYRNHRRTHYKVSGGDFEILPRREGEEGEGAPSGLESKNPTPPPGPTKVPERPSASRPKETYTCSLTHLSGWTFLHMLLKGGDWRKVFNTEFMLYVRGSRMDFYLDGRGSAFWGLLWRDYRVRIRHDELYKNIKCIDQCTKILVDSWGTPQRRDRLLVAGYSFEISYLDSMDTVYVSAEIASGMDGILSLSSNISGAPSVSATETPTELRSGTGSNAFKCVKVRSS